MEMQWGNISLELTHQLLIAMDRIQSKTLNVRKMVNLYCIDIQWRSLVLNQQNQQLRPHQINFLFFERNVFFAETEFLEATDFIFFFYNVVWIYIIVQTASVQCPRLHLLWQGCLLYICNSRGTIVLFYWWIGNRVKLNRLCLLLF